MTTVRLTPMPAAALDEWRARRADAGDPRSALPEPGEGETEEPLLLVADGDQIGSVLVFCAEDHGVRRCSVRALETTVASDDIVLWADVLTAIADHARDTGATAVTTSVPPRLAPHFERAGYRATAVTHGKRLEGRATGFQHDRRVEVRPMTDDERRTFAEGVRATLDRTLPESGLPVSAGTSSDLAARIATLTDDPVPPGELLVTATVEGQPVGCAWASLVERDGALDFYGNLMEIFPGHRGQGLTRSLIGALARYLREIGVRDVHIWAHGDDERTRTTFLDAGVGVADVHLHRDLDD